MAQTPRAMAAFRFITIDGVQRGQTGALAAEATHE